MKVNIIDGQLTKNFNIKEFVDNYSGSPELYIDERFILFVLALQKFRDWYRRPINIISCYRSNDCNNYYGGSKNSAHLVSCAVDFPLPYEFKNYTEYRQEMYLWNVKTKWDDICNNLGMCSQVNFYDNRLHLGVADKESFLDLRSA